MSANKQDLQVLHTRAFLYCQGDFEERDKAEVEDFYRAMGIIVDRDAKDVRDTALHYIQKNEYYCKVKLLSWTFFLLEIIEIIACKLILASL